MATIDPTSTTTAGQAQQKAKTQDAFGKDAFMKILVEQLRHQAPDSSSDPNAFINQMTQFSILEQQQQQTAGQTRSNAAAYLGRTVSYFTAAGKSGEGTVEKVDFGGTEPTFTVAGQAGIKPKEVTEVR